MGAALSALLAPALAAQEVQGRDALWYGAGLGPGVARVQCSICRANRGTAATGVLRLGGRLKRGLLVGAEATLWAGGVQSGVHESMWGLDAVAYYYPRARGTLYWKLGAGMLSWRSVDGRDVLSAGAPGLVLGTGWEFRIARQLTLAPYASLFMAPVGGDIKFNGAGIQQNASLLLGQLGVSITKH
ncbi:MAG TPA: hypothetical protein VMF70_01675 [Gemmatimonadales bacterium]|nr:hypothetical protein [Gemmatimonadales bacterium]